MTQDRLQTRCRLTTSAVAKLKHTGKGRKTIFWDDRTGPNFVRGLCVVCYASGEKTYFVRLPAPSTRARYRMHRLDHCDLMTAEQARKAASAAWEAHRLGKPVQTTTDAITVREAAGRFLKEYRTAGKGRPIADSHAWKANLRRLTDAIGSRTLESIGAADVQAIIDPLPQATARAVRSNVSTLWDYAVAERWIGPVPNPCRRVNVNACQVTTGKRKACLTGEQVARCIELADASPDTILGGYMRLLSATGHRPGELCRARWEDCQDGRVLVRETKKGRPITLPPAPSQDVTRALDVLRETTGDMVGVFGPSVDTEACERVYRGLARAWGRATKGTEVAWVKLSHFRSTVATTAYRQAHERALAEAQAALQHRDARVTEQSYVVE